MEDTLTKTETRLLALVRELAIEMAVIVEHYDQDTAAWFPQTIVAIRKAADELQAAGQMLPEPVYFTLARAKRRLGGHVLTVNDVAAVTRLTKAEVVARALGGTIPGARKSGNRWVFDRDPLIAAGMIAWEDPHELAHNAALMAWMIEVPSLLSKVAD